MSTKLTLEAKARHAAIWADQAGQLELVKDADLAHYLATILVEAPAVQDLIRERVERDYRAGLRKPKIPQARNDAAGRHHRTAIAAQQ